MADSMTDDERPEWQQRLEDTIGEAKMPKYLIQALLAEEYRPLITRAAAKRGIPVSAYLRRAMMAFVAYDLDIDFLELAVAEPAITESENLPPRRFRGKGFGKWRIRKLD